MELNRCMLCPRACGADRTRGVGRCGGGSLPRVARAMLHHWEEPVISGVRGSGAVFFSGCSLCCCFCQNWRISAGQFGRELSVEQLAAVFLSLQEQGAHNLNLVNPTHFAPQIVEALRLLGNRLQIPVVCNTGGYDSPEVLALFDGWVDIYLADLKYVSPTLSARYAGAPDYFQVVSHALPEMFRQTGPVLLGEDGLLKKGLIVRHLVLPNARHDSIHALRWLRSQFAPDEILLSLMSQYTPAHRSADFPELNRRLRPAEYDAVVNEAVELGFKQGFMQELSAAKEEYTPIFDLSGLSPPPLSL